MKYWLLARDGVPNLFKTPDPRSRCPQPQPSPEATKVLKGKITKMIQRRYLAPPDKGLLSLIKYFAVPKGEGDWRVIYHAGANSLTTVCGCHLSIYPQLTLCYTSLISCRIWKTEILERCS